MNRLVILVAVASALVFGACASDTVVTVVVTATPAADPTPVIHTVVVPATPEIRLVEITSTPAPTPPPIIHTVIVTATPGPTSTPVPTMESMEESMAGMSPELPEIQEIGLIENYAANRYFPRNIVVLKDIPVRIYITRLHREHINKFTIAPFYSSSEVILPGEVGVIEFIPDQAGEFKISNVGHGNEADLIVVETQEEARKYIEGRGEQMYALIHSVDDSRMYPETVAVRSGTPVTILNINLIDQHQVSIESFLSPEGLNVKPGEVSMFEFTPETRGAYTIRHELHGFTGELIVK